MSSIRILVLLLVSVFCHESFLKTASAMDEAKPEERKPSKLDELRKLADLATSSDSSRRKSRILGSLAFLAGLSVGGMAGAGSTAAKTNTRAPSVTLNLAGSRLTPYFAAFYDPQVYAAQSLLYNPFYSLLDPARLQAAVAAQNYGQGGQNQAHQVLNVFGNKEELDSGEDYERQDEKAAGNSAENNENNVELGADSSVEDQRPVTCSTPTKKLASGSKGVGSLREDPFDSKVPNRVTNLSQTKNATIPDPLTVTTTNGTNSSDPSVHYTPGYGYYGGDPHIVDHVDFTTRSSVVYDYPAVNYNLRPPYQRPASFYPDQGYGYYGHSDGQYLHDQPGEYANPDYNRLLYTPDNPPYANGFRPL